MNVFNLSIKTESGIDLMPFKEELLYSQTYSSPFSFKKIEQEIFANAFKKFGEWIAMTSYYIGDVGFFDIAVIGRKPNCDEFIKFLDVTFLKKANSSMEIEQNFETFIFFEKTTTSIEDIEKTLESLNIKNYSIIQKSDYFEGGASGFFEDIIVAVAGTVIGELLLDKIKNSRKEANSKIFNVTKELKINIAIQIGCHHKNLVFVNCNEKENEYKLIFKHFNETILVELDKELNIKKIEVDNK